MTKHCLICGGEFEGHGRQLYCSEACRREARERRKKEQAGQSAGSPKMETRCSGCRYYCTSTRGCGYLEITGKSRLGLHRGEEHGINEPCREFEARKEGKGERGCRK